MATTQIKIEAQVQQALKAIDDLKRSLNGINSSASSVNRSMAGIERSTNLAAQAFGALAAAISVREIVGLADAATLVNNKLRSVSPTAEIAAQAFQRVGQIAQTTGQNFEAVGDLYQKVALQSANLGLTQGEVARVTENFSKALVITGTTGQAAASAIYQFGQALGRGRVAYEDIRQLQEASSATVALIGKQFNMSGQQFVKAVQDGKISSEQLALAVNALGAEVNPTFNQMNKTVGQSMENIRTSFILLINNFEKSTGTFAAVANVLDVVAKNIDVVVVAASAFMAVFAAKKIVEMAVAFRTLNTVMKANPMILLATVAAGIAVSIYEMTKSSDELNDASKDVLDTQEQIRNVVDSTGKGFEELTKEQENALKALNSTIANIQIQAQYQRDILDLGQQEADIRKRIAEEGEKLAKVGLTLDAQQKTKLRNAIAEEESARRLVQAYRQQTDAIGKLILANDPVSQQIEKFNDLKMMLEKGWDTTELEKFKAARTRALDPRGEQALKNQRALVSQEIDIELSKYDPMLAAWVNYNKAKDSLVSMEAYKKQGILTIGQEQALAKARLEIEAQYQADRLKAIEETNRKIQDREIARINAVLMAERGGIAQALSAKDQQVLQQIGLEERQRAIVQERIAFEKKSELEKAAFAVDQGAQMFSALGAQNKKAFEAAKAFNIANAIMNTYMAATKALATYPWPFGMVAAAAAVGMGLAQVAQIRSQTYSGRQLGGPVMANKSYIVGENGPELFTPNNTGSITRNGDLGGGAPVNVTFNVVANDTAGFDDLLLSRRGMIRSIISDAMLESGRRG